MALEAAAEGVPIIPVYPGVVYGPGKVTAGNVFARLVKHFVLFFIMSVCNKLKCALNELVHNCKLD